MQSLAPDELQQYARHLTLAEVGLRGQERLKASKVLVIGAGGLGCPALMYLAAAGVGTLGIVDDDTVDRSNLQRQVLFGTDDIGRPKAECAAKALQRLNPFIEVIAYRERFDAANALRLISDFDVIVDATDNFTAKYLANDACYFARKPLVYASISEFEGQLAVFNAPGPGGKLGPNLRDVYSVPPPAGFARNCAEAGVLGVLPGILGCLQANETLKLLLELRDGARHTMTLFDALDLSFTTVRLRARSDNPLSGDAPTVRELSAIEYSCTVAPRPDEVTFAFIEEHHNSGTPLQIIDVREPHEREVASIGGRLIPLASLASRLEEVDPDIDTVVYCKSGGRSLRALTVLAPRMRRGRCYSLAGGMDACIRGGIAQ